MSPVLHLVVPAEIDDPGRPSGGNHYDRRISIELVHRGWRVIEHRIDHGASPATALAALPDDASVIVDGLIGSPWAEVLLPAARRLRIFSLLHQAQNTPVERAGLLAAAGVIVPSDWTRRWLLDTYRLSPARVSVAEPGADPAPLAIGTEAGTRLLCVAAVAEHKGQDRLITALADLADLADLSWHCVCVGTVHRDPAFVARLRRQLDASGLTDRVELIGSRAGDDLAGCYGAADALVLPSQAETYGMVVTEALARGVPVIASEVGGVPEAMGVSIDGHRPGLLVPPGNHEALAAALHRWLTDAELRAGLRRAARLRRGTLSSWARTAERIECAVISGWSAQDRAGWSEPAATGGRISAWNARR